MDTKIMNFKMLEVCGATKSEALEKAPFYIMGDATQKFKNWKCNKTSQQINFNKDKCPKQNRSSRWLQP